MDKPKPGWATECKLTRVIDGDTVEVEITRRFHVRLIHPDSEKQFHVEDGSQEDELATEILNTFCRNKYPCTLWIPTNEAEKLMDWNSFNRVLGALWIKDTCVTTKFLEMCLGELR